MLVIQRKNQGIKGLKDRHIMLLIFMYLILLKANVSQDGFTPPNHLYERYITLIKIASSFILKK